MNAKYYLLFLLSFFSVYANLSFADGEPITINITGNVIASPCTVDPDSVRKDISLGDIKATDLSTTGQVSPWVNFEIDLVNCPATTVQAIALFHGTPDPSTPLLYKNTGTATNIAIELAQQGTGYDFSDGKTAIVPVSNGSAVLKLSTRAKSTADNVLPGTIDAVVTLDLSYN